jgi:hypothetical protein
MRKHNESGEILIGTMLVAMWVAGVFGCAVGSQVADHKTKTALAQKGIEMPEEDERHALNINNPMAPSGPKLHGIHNDAPKFNKEDLK